MPNIFTRIRTAVKAFQETDFVVFLPDADDFADFEARKLRYQVYWAFYENTVYRNLHAWSQALRNRYGLYKYIRAIYNPSMRLCDFYKSMIWGGVLDTDEGDEGAIPIQLGQTASEILIPAIINIYDNSNWATQKDIATLWGSVLGDVGIKIIDDTEREQVRYELIHPSKIKELDIDGRGFCRGYELEENRILDGKAVTYTEIAKRELNDDNIYYQTLLNGKPYAWNEEQGAEWNEPYGFVPFVHIQHNNVGLDWGWSELHAGRPKFQELDDIASKLHDHIRKMVDPMGLANFKEPKSSSSAETATATTDRPQPGREELNIYFTGQESANVQWLVTDLNIDHAGAECNNMIKELERDFPELQMDIWSLHGGESGKAMEAAQKKVVRKVVERRNSYDNKLVQANQMGVAIGGMRGYDNYEGFSLDSYKAGLLDHVIKPDRPVFELSRSEQLQEHGLFWDTIQKATKAGIDLETALREIGGWTDTQLTKYGVQKMAAIALEQEDVIPQDERGQLIEQ